MIDKKEKNYLSDNVLLMAEWDWERNVGLSPSQLTIGSNKKVWWIGKCGHNWEAQIKSRYHGRGCPVCTGKTVIAGINDISTTDPSIIAEWDSDKNYPLLPSQVTRNSHTKVWWACQNGHSWQASPNHRISKKRGCPYCCHNPRVLEGKNDLATVYPALSLEWHPTRNESLLPTHVTANSNKRVWWICAMGHEWRTSINHRANGSGCPYCKKSMQTSFPEQAVFYYTKKAYPDTVNQYTDIFEHHRMELDVFIPSLKIGIEYDGIAFHKTQVQQQREIKKYSICKAHGISLIRIKEDVSAYTINACDYLIQLTTDLSTALIQLSTILPKLTDIDVIRDEQLIRSMYHSELKSKTLQHLFPSLAQEWNYNRNERLNPTMFTAHSNVEVWWLCSNGHEWKSSIDARVRGNGCPYCSNRLVLSGYNDLAHKRPDLMAEWDYSQNEISPSSVLPGSGKKAWWICSSCGNRWFAEISSRNKGHGCPICSRKSHKSNSSTNN